MDIVKFYNLFTECRFQFTTDSRSLKTGDIFFALKGENFNGNSYAIQVLEAGAAYAVVDEVTEQNDRLIQVKDVLQFMQDLAQFHRKCFDIPIIGICGSNGKTTSKNLIQEVLRSKYKTHCTAGNFNNHIGLPVTLLSMPQDTEIGIVELGTNSPGEIKLLCDISLPNYGLITNIGKEHLEGFGNLEAIAKEESEIYRFINDRKGHIFLNADDEWLTRMSRSITKKVSYSKTSVDINSLVPDINFNYKGLLFHSKLMGDYNLDNILLALAIGEHFDVELEDIQKAIARYEPDNNRSQLLKRGSNTIILDAYNANPSSMQVAIRNFSKMPQEKKVLILGDMFEMGPTANQEHHELLQWCNKFEFDNIFTLGNHFGAISLDSGILTPESMEELEAIIQKEEFQETAFLIKGSRGMKMERVLDFL